MPRKTREQPSAMDRLDPAPEERRAPQRQRASRPRRPPAGDQEKAVKAFLGRLPPELGREGFGPGLLSLARQLDSLDRMIASGEAPPGVFRDAAAHQREIRQGIATLREWAPGAVESDKTGEAESKRERRLTVIEGSG